MTHDFVNLNKAAVLVGGQFGSEAKGLAAGILVWDSAMLSSNPPGLICTTNAGAQAGHTTVLPDGRTFVCYHLPTIGVLIRSARIYLNAGSIIDQDLLNREIKAVTSATGEPEQMLRDRITLHPNAALINDSHKEAESTATRGVGSTMKGVGAALADKIMRRPSAIAKNLKHSGIVGAIEAMDLNLEATRPGMVVTVEIPQGTGLSLNAAPFYPHCTSRDCWVGQGMADAGLHPSLIGHVLMVCRTYPIRVGNIFDAEGQRVGYSGDFYPDSREMDWARDLPGIAPELTTVTKRVRRIASWSRIQYRHALSLNRPSATILTFVNYLKSPSALAHLVKDLDDDERRVLGYQIPKIYSWGPSVHQYSYDVDEAMHNAGLWNKVKETMGKE